MIIKYIGEPLSTITLIKIECIIPINLSPFYFITQILRSGVCISFSTNEIELSVI